MARTLMAFLLPALAFIPSLGCAGQICTDAGCGSSVNFYFPGLDLNEDRRVNVVDAEGCLGDICHRMRWRFERNGAARGTGTGIDVSPRGSGLSAGLVLPHDADLNIRDSYRSWMQLSVNGGEPVRVEDDVRLGQVQPNGPGCGPVCLQADVGTPLD